MNEGLKAVRYQMDGLITTTRVMNKFGYLMTKGRETRRLEEGSFAILDSDHTVRNSQDAGLHASDGLTGDAFETGV